MENSKQPVKKKGGLLGYIVTALAAFILGFLISFAFRASAFEKFNEGTASATEEPKTTANTQNTPEVSGSNEPSSTFTPLSMELDGVLPTITDDKNPIPDIVEQLTSGVVSIMNYGYSEHYDTELEQGSGTGFVISTEGYIITNAHILEEASSVSVLLAGDEEIDVEIIGVDKTSDVALLKIDSKYTPVALALGDSNNVRVGEFAIAIGDPTGRELAGTPTFGIISATEREVNIDGRTNLYLQTDAAINPGSSGGPLLNMKGEVIGIASAKTVTASYDEYGNAISAEGLGFAIPINDAMEIAYRLLERGSIERPGIGVSVSSLTQVQADFYQVPMGALIITITKGGKGEEAGLEVGDIITSCDGIAITDQDEFVQAVQSKKVGDVIKVIVWREGEEFEAVIEIGDLNKMSSETLEEEFDFSEFD